MLSDVLRAVEKQDILMDDLLRQGATLREDIMETMTSGSGMVPQEHSLLISKAIQIISITSHSLSIARKLPLYPSTIPSGRGMVPQENLW